MKVRLENDWPVNSTRFLLPVVAVRGFRAGPRTVTLAWWTWRIVVHLHNASLERTERSDDTLQDLVRRLQDAAADYLRVTRTRGNGEPAHYLPPANRSVEEVKAAEYRLRALLPNNRMSDQSHITEAAP